MDEKNEMMKPHELKKKQGIETLWIEKSKVSKPRG